MHKKLNFKKRIDLLLISIDALNLYTSEQLPHDNYQQKISKDIFLIRAGNYIRHPNSYSILEFIKSIHLIHDFHTFIMQSYLQEIILHILKNYSNQNKCEITLKYIDRFTYIYQQTQNYYNIRSHYTNLQVKQLAIINLYIIHKIHSRWGLYFLIKYLYLNF